MARRPRTRNDDLKAILAALEGRGRASAPRETHVDVNVGGNGLTKWAQKIKDLQQLLIALGLVGGFAWIFLGPFVQAQAESIVKSQLIAIGADPATIQSLNGSVKGLQDTVNELQKAKDESKEATEELSDDVKALKSELAPLIELLKLQALKGTPPLEPAK